MTISQDTEHKILRYHFVEKWKVGTIASQLSVHYSVVERVLSQAGLPKIERASRPSIIDPYLPFITDTLAQFPNLTAARLYDMVCERGYPGKPSLFRQKIAELRPRPPPQAYLRLQTLPGEQAQVDWGHFGSLTIGQAKRPLMAFVMVLSWSRQIFLQFYLNSRMESFLRGHVSAFAQWQGLPKVLLYDNLKSAVLEREGKAIRFHPTLLELASHYRFEPRPVAVARGNEKGRVERAIRYIRDNFFAGRQWQDLDDLNRQARRWCQTTAAKRRCPQDTAMTVAEAFIQEQPRLVTLPDNPFDTDECCQVSVRKTPYIRFDLNDYSVPHTYVQRSLTVRASVNQVRILDGAQMVATHPRSQGKGEQIEQQSHIDALCESKYQGTQHHAQQRLAKASPLTPTLLQGAIDRGHTLKRTLRELNDLLHTYGRAEYHLAVEEALKHQLPTADGVRQVLVRRRDEQGLQPAIAIPVPDSACYTVTPQQLNTYDALCHPGEDHDS